jgi:acetyl esterase/lipase
MKRVRVSVFCTLTVLFLLGLPFYGCQKPKTSIENNLLDSKMIATNKTKNASKNQETTGPSIVSDLTNPIAPNQRKWLDIPYSTLSPRQKLDIYLPQNGNGPFPVIISIHGGGLVEGDKVGLDLKAAKHGLERGYAVVSINYRLLGEAKIPAQIMDVKTAIRYIRANAYAYYLNPMKLALWGGSAGGYLASLAGTSADYKEFIDPNQGNSNQSDRVQAVVDWYGPISNLSVMGVEESYITNPATFISKDDPAFLIQHGKEDRLVSYEQSVSFAQKLKNTLGNKRVELSIFDTAGHADSQFFTPENINNVLNFLDRFMK